MAFLYQITINPKDAETCGGCDFMVTQDHDCVTGCGIFGGELKYRQTRQYDIYYLRCNECKQAELASICVDKSQEETK
jgi:hypothetical protein